MLHTLVQPLVQPSLSRSPAKLRIGLFALLLTLGLPLGAAVSTGTTEIASEQPFGATIDVRVVEVEAVVTGKNGERLQGLDASDFRLLVDGREVPVRFFDEVRGVAGQTGRLTVAGTISGGGLSESLSGVQRNYLVFIDDTFTQRGRRQRLLNQLIDQARTLGPDERMAVVRYEGHALEVISDWTDSRDQLQRALTSARDRTPTELIRRAQTSGAANPVLNARLRADQIADVTDAMGAAMRSLAGVEGRLLFLPVSSGWPYDPTLDAGDPLTAVSAAGLGFQSGPQGFQIGDLPTLADISHYLNDRLLLPVADTANLLGYTIYPLHVGFGNNVEWSSLWSIARQTGGAVAAEEGFSRGPLDTVREDTSSYYVLAFTPDWEWNDERHEVEVEVDLPGAKVRHRRSFLDLSRDTQRALRVEEALLVDLTPGDLDVTLGEARRIKRSVVEVPVELEIPMDWVTAMPEGDAARASLELRVAALDARGQRSDMPVIPVTLPAESRSSGGQDGDGLAVYATQVRLRNAPQRLVLSLTDTVSGEARVGAVDFLP